jgi:hypothetical protein
MTNTPTKTYLVGVIERAIAYYKVDAEDARSAAENWQDGEFHDRDDEALESDEPCNVCVKHADGTWMLLPPSEWEAELPLAIPLNKPYSVLLLYPDYINDRGDETYYAFVEASDPLQAVAVAQRQATAAQDGVDTDPDEFAPLLVTEGHCHSEPLFNK